MNINRILEREPVFNNIKTILASFEKNSKDINHKRGIYIYGASGCGKTFFISDLLKTLDYDAIKYDAGDVRNKALIESITCNNISNQNVLDMMSKKKKRIVIVMDEIEAMNNGDKGGITSLIKLIRQKKTKKQTLENTCSNPIICIGNYYDDKKIKELMKVCYVFELKEPTMRQMFSIVENYFPNMDLALKKNITNYVQGDMRKLSFIFDIQKKKPELLNHETIQNILHVKLSNKDSKKLTQTLFEKPAKKIEEHNLFMNETDRTIVALLWHENIVDAIAKWDTKVSFPFYLQFLDNMCFSDYMYRITFQNQIWQLNEMSSLIKTFYNQKIFHEVEQPLCEIKEIRFTKVLTKYSTEYNNILFVYNLCMELGMDKKDVVSFFQELRILYQNEYITATERINEMEKLFVNYDIDRLDILRVYRYMDKNIKVETSTAKLLEDEDE
jgi:hypothetical protein